MEAATINNVGGKKCYISTTANSSLLFSQESLTHSQCIILTSQPTSITLFSQKPRVFNAETTEGRMIRTQNALYSNTLTLYEDPMMQTDASTQTLTVCTRDQPVSCDIITTKDASVSVGKSSLIDTAIETNNLLTGYAGVSDKADNDMTATSVFAATSTESVQVGVEGAEDGDDTASVTGSVAASDVGTAITMQTETNTLPSETGTMYTMNESAGGISSLMKPQGVVASGNAIPPGLSAKQVNDIQKILNSPQLAQTLKLAELLVLETPMLKTTRLYKGIDDFGDLPSEVFAQAQAVSHASSYLLRKYDPDTTIRNYTTRKSELRSVELCKLWDCFTDSILAGFSATCMDFSIETGALAVGYGASTAATGSCGCVAVWLPENPFWPFRFIITADEVSAISWVPNTKYLLAVASKTGGVSIFSTRVDVIQKLQNAMVKGTVRSAASICLPLIGTSHLTGRHSSVVWDLAFTASNYNNASGGGGTSETGLVLGYPNSPFLQKGRNGNTSSDSSMQTSYDALVSCGSDGIVAECNLKRGMEQRILLSMTVVGPHPIEEITNNISQSGNSNSQGGFGGANNGTSVNAAGDNSNSGSNMPNSSNSNKGGNKESNSDGNSSNGGKITIVRKLIMALSLDLAPDKLNYLISGDDGRIRRAIRTNVGRCHQIYSGHSASVYRVRFNPILPTFFASSSADGTVKIWSVENTSPLLSLTSMREGGIYAMDWCPFKSTVIASGGASGIVEIWDIERSLITPCQIIKTRYYPSPLVDARKARRNRMLKKKRGLNPVIQKDPFSLPANMSVNNGKESISYDLDELQKGNENENDTQNEATNDEIEDTESGETRAERKRRLRLEKKRMKLELKQKIIPVSSLKFSKTLPVLGVCYADGMVTIFRIAGIETSYNLAKINWDEFIEVESDRLKDFL